MDNYYGIQRPRRSTGQPRRGPVTTRSDGPKYYQSQRFSNTPVMPVQSQQPSNYYTVPNYMYGGTQDYISFGQASPYYEAGYNTEKFPQKQDEYGKDDYRKKVAVILIVIILVLAIVAAIPLAIYLGGKSSDDVTTTTTGIPTSTATGIPTIPLSGILTLPDQSFTPELDDPSSTEFVELATAFCNKMTILYSGDNLDLIQCVVHGFIDGSVLVNFTLYFDNAEDSNDQEVRKNATTALLEGIENTGTDTLTITADSAEFETDGNDCESDECEQLCQDGYFTFTCDCYQGYNLSQDGQACTGKQVHSIGAIVLNQTFEEGLTDASSVVYQMKEVYVCQEFDNVFEGINSLYNYTNCSVNNFLEGSIVVNLTLTFDISQLLNVTEFLDDVGEAVELQIQNKTIFGDTAVTYYDFDNDIDWCYDDPTVCGQRGCDAVQCICDEEDFYHGNFICGKNVAIEMRPSYKDESTLYLSTEVVPDSVLDRAYHVLVCIVRTSATDSEGVPVEPTWLDSSGNTVPLYSDVVDLNNQTIGPQNYPRLTLPEGTWMLALGDYPYVRILAFSSPEASDSGMYSCQVPQQLGIEVSLDIQFVDCTEAPYVMCGGHRQCIPEEQLCDEEIQCLDASYTPTYVDELYCNCTAETFSCANGQQCIPTEYQCDAHGRFECADGSDQINCNCSGDTYQCSSADRCIPLDWMCDGHGDCPDNDDETEAVCVNVCTEANKYLCTDSTVCLGKAKLCDGYMDCPQADDEFNCTKTCSAEESPCPGLEYICIHSDHLCDGHSDCPNNADEQNCTCFEHTCILDNLCIANSSVCDGQCDCTNCTEEYGCNCTGGYVCANTQCIPATEDYIFCNNHPACIDGSDEPENCSCTADQYDCGPGDKCLPQTYACDGYLDCDTLLYNSTISPDELNCNCSELFTCDNGKCVNNATVCDGFNHCGDWTDELNCSYCTPEEKRYLCPGHGLCIRDNKVCDGFPHCLDGADELNCTECVQNTFKCVRDGEEQCVPKEWICDGTVECDNKEDELNCENCLEFSCTDYKKCLNFTQQCDTVRDCEDGSDEWQCFRVEEENGALKYFDGATGDLIPVCGNNWKDDYNQDICDMLGMGSAFGHEVVVNLEEDRRYLIYGDTLRIGPTNECGAETLVKVLCQSTECGKRSENLAASFIINGEEALPGYWPWQVELIIEGYFQCGGTLVDHQWVVTAAHCVVPLIDNKLYEIRMGSLKREGYDPDAFVAKVEAVIPHSDYNDYTLDNDIALIKFREKVAYTDYIKPACLPQHRTLPESTSVCYTTGFGTINVVNPFVEQQLLSEVLLEAKMAITTHDSCNTRFGVDIVTGSQLCAGYIQGSISICNGDSGGPLVCLDQFNTWKLTGVTSWSISDELTGRYCTSYSGFADVSYFTNWIKQQMQDN